MFDVRLVFADDDPPTAAPATVFFFQLSAIPPVPASGYYLSACQPFASGAASKSRTKIDCNDSIQELIGIAVRPMIFKCSFWMVGLLFAGAIGPLALIPLVPVLGWPLAIQWILAGVATFLVVYALTLIPTRLVLSDEGLWQMLLLTELRLRWEDMTEWRYTIGPERDYLWIRDRDGRKHQPKRWLVFGQRMAEFAAVLQARGIHGEIQRLKR